MHTKKQSLMCFGNKNPYNKQIKRTENTGVLSEKHNQIEVVGRNFSSPPLIVNR